jgi:hypothetical protein
MTSRKVTQRSLKRTSPNSTDVQVRGKKRPEHSDHQKLSVRLHLVVFAAASLIVFSRRPDALLNAQFYAEDGVCWYHDAYAFGLRSLAMVYSGYLHTLLRLVALFSRLFPFALAPLIMNLAGVAVQVLPVNVFLSSRFSEIRFPIRLLASFIYLALPNTFEIDANLTNVQWHLALLACMLLLAQPATTTFWAVFDSIVLVLTSFTTPIVILLVPVAALMWWKRRNKSSAIAFALLSPGMVVQAIVVLLHLHARQTPHYSLAGMPILNGGALGASLDYFAAIMGRQVFISSLLGLNTQDWILQLDYVAVVEVIATLIGILSWLYVLRNASIELKAFVLFSCAVLALGLINPLAGPPAQPQWYWLSKPGVGNRYYFLPMLSFLAALLWMATRKASPLALRYAALGLLLMLPIGIYQDWSYPAFTDYHFGEFAARFEQAAAGTRIKLPINPGWIFELTKH